MPRFEDRADTHGDNVPWDLGSPTLYTVEVALVADGEIVDTVTRETGFRTFTAERGKFFLNGREIYLRAVLDQDYHPGGTSVPDDFAEWERLLVETKALGFNMLRVHIKRPHPRYYEIADRIGLLVWTELPSWMTWTPEAAAAGHALLRSLIERDGHHPSIVVWTVMNESWGIDLADADQRAWLRDVFDDVEQHAAGSLVVDNSACEPNFHLRTHIDDYHVYRGIPETRRVWDDKIADFASRPDWTFSPHGDAVRTGEEPLVLSEFGNWGLPHAIDQYEADGSEPWWFALGAGWAFGAAEGTHLLPRFRSLGLADVFGSWQELVRQLHHAQLVANRYQTTSIRLHDEISGYVLTQLCDVQWEANGLFDMNRTPKTYTGEFGLANGEHAVALRPDAYSVFAGDDLAATVTSLPSPQG
ncbi:MAG: glycoside hydrolase family 2, partial [Microbacterium sp.]